VELRDPGQGERSQFERPNWIARAPEGACGRPVFNRTATLKDPWTRIEKKQQPDG
jgi:hypothetical protein